jgi:hypothetical protein
MAMSMGINQYRKNKLAVQYWSLEMSTNNFWARAVANISHVPYRDVRASSRDPDLATKLQHDLEEFDRVGLERDKPFSFASVDQGGFTPSKLEARQGACPFVVSPDVVIVDSAGMFAPEGRRAHEQISEVHRYFNFMSKRLDCVVVLVQQTRSIEPWVYTECCDYLVQWSGVPMLKEYYKTELHLAKSRFTSTRKFDVKFDLDYMTVS